MRNILKWAALAVLMVLSSCSKVDYSGNIPYQSEPGVYGYMAPFIDGDTQGTKATVDPDNNWKYVWETGDRINIWSDSGTLLVYTVTEVSDDGTRATFNGGGFTLTEGSKYYSSHPLIHSVLDDYKNLTVTYQGQKQAADNEARHLAEYTYSNADAKCENGRTSFNYSAVNAYIRFVITLPDALTLTELTITAKDEDFFAVNGTINVTTGEFTPGEKSSTMTLKLDNIQVADKELNAFLSIAPCDAGEYVIRVKDIDGKVYTSPKITKDEIPARFTRRFATEVFEGEDPAVAKIGDVYYSSFAKAVAAVNTNDETIITMIGDEDIEASGYAVTIESGKNIVLDLNGNTITGICSDASTSALILNQGSLTICDSGSNGKLIGGADNTWTWDGSDDYTGSYASNLIRNEGTLIVNGGILYNASSGSAAYAIDNYSAGQVTINSGTVDAKRASAIRMFYNNGGVVNVNGGTIGHYNSDDDCSYMGIQAQSGTNAIINVTGGTVSGNYALYSSATGSSAVTISGGSFDGLVGFGSGVTSVSVSGGMFNDWVWPYGSQTGFITGGLFAIDHSRFVAEDYIVIANTDPETKEDYPYTVVEDTNEYAAKIGGTKYLTLEAAFAAAEDGDTITLLEDSNGNGIIAPQGKFGTAGLTVDFNGHSYDFSGTGVGSTGTKNNGFQLLQGNTITFKNGTITASSEDAGFLIQNYSDLTLQNMVVDGSGVWGGYVLSNNNGNVTIDGTTITAPSEDFAFDVCRYASYPSVNVTVKGASIINGNVEVSASSSNAMNGFGLTVEAGTFNGNLVIDGSAATAMANTPDKAVIKKAEAVTLDAPSGFKWEDNGDGTSTLKAVVNVAKIGDVEYETLESAFAAVQDGQTITLVSDCAGNGIQAPQGKFTNGVTIDFNGFTYTMDGEMVGSTGTQTQAFQLLKDNKITFKNGTIESSKALMLIQNYSDLTLEGMTLNLNTIGQSNLYTLSNNNGNIVIDGTTINAASTTNSFAFDVCRYASYPSVNVTVKGASIINGNVEVSASSSNAMNGFGLTVEAGTFNGNLVIDGSAATAMANTPDKAVIKKAEAVTLDAPSGFKWEDNGDGTSTLKAVVNVAKIGDVEYETLESAFAAVQDGQTITLVSDCAGNGIQAPQGKFTNGVTIDFNGYTYTMDGTMVGSTGTETQAFQLLKDNKVTFKNGTITSEKAKFLIQNYSDLTLQGMTLTLNNANYSSAYTLSNNNGNIVIEGTTINANPNGGFAFDVCRYSSYPSVNVTVKGASVINGKIEFDAGSGDPKNGVNLILESGTVTGTLNLTNGGSAALRNSPDKAKITKSDNVTLAAPNDFQWVDNGNGTSTLKANVARVGGNEYVTLEAAFAAAQDGQTITLMADCAGNGMIASQNKYATGLTIDFNGHTYDFSGTGVGSSGTENNGFQLLTGNTVTFKNGTLTASSEDAGFLIQNYSNLTLQNMVVDGTDIWGGYTLSNNNGNVIIDGSTIIAPAGGFAFDVCRYSSYPSVNVTVKGASVINGNIEVSASGSDPKDGFSLTVNAGTINGSLVIDSTAANVMASTPEKAVIKKVNAVSLAAPDNYEWNDNNDGTSTLAVL